VPQQTRESFVDPRVRPWLLVSLGISLALVMLAMGVVAPVSGAAVQAELGARIVRDIQRLRAAVADYALDTGEVPPAVFDLSRGYDGGMTDVDTAPFRVRASWNGPYLPGSMARPRPARPGDHRECSPARVFPPGNRPPPRRSQSRKTGGRTGRAPPL
jgi:hypothetical protein